MDKRPEKASEEFLRAITGMGTAILECEHCDRVIFAPDSDLDFDEDYMEELLRKLATQPDKYVQVEYESVSWGYLDGKQTPVDCPCNSARKFEDFIWNHRHIIASYFRARLDATKKDLATEERMLDPALMSEIERL